MFHKKCSIFGSLQSRSECWLFVYLSFLIIHSNYIKYKNTFVRQSGQSKERKHKSLQSARHELRTSYTCSTLGHICQGQRQVSWVRAAASHTGRDICSERTQTNTVTTVPSRARLAIQRPVSWGGFFQGPMLQASGKIPKYYRGKMYCRQNVIQHCLSSHRTGLDFDMAAVVDNVSGVVFMM